MKKMDNAYKIIERLKNNGQITNNEYRLLKSLLAISENAIDEWLSNDDIIRDCGEKNE